MTHGYGQTTVADIAEEAGVALQTVYSSVGPKAALLVALLDQARDDAGIADIDAQARAHEGTWALLASGPRVRRAMMEHGGDVIRLLAENAGAEPDVARAWEELLRRAQQGAETAMALLEQQGALRRGLDPGDAADQACAIMHPMAVVYLLDRGWSLDRIEAWMLDMLVRSVTDLEAPSSGHHRPPGMADPA